MKGDKMRDFFSFDMDAKNEVRDTAILNKNYSNLNPASLPLFEVKFDEMGESGGTKEQIVPKRNKPDQEDHKQIAGPQIER